MSKYVDLTDRRLTHSFGSDLRIGDLVQIQGRYEEIADMISVGDGSKSVRLKSGKRVKVTKYQPVDVFRKL
ncbi:hypothetical protein [Streptomyces harbinensis]